MTSIDVIRQMLITSLCVFPAICSGAQPAQVNAVQFIQPSDPGFATTLNEQFPGIATASSYSAMRPYLVLLVNRDLEQKPAYSVRWTVTYNDHRVRYVDQIVQRRNNKPLLAGETRLVSPVFNLSPSQYRSLPHFGLLYPEDMFPQSPEISSVSAVLDALISNDDSVQGAGQTSLKLRYACSAQAATDESKLVSTLVREGHTIPEILGTLQLQISEGLAAGAKQDAASFYTFERGQHAQALVNLIRNKEGKGLELRLATMRGDGRHQIMPCVTPVTAPSLVTQR